MENLGKSSTFPIKRLHFEEGTNKKIVTSNFSLLCRIEHTTSIASHLLDNDNPPLTLGNLVRNLAATGRSPCGHQPFGALVCASTWPLEAQQPFDHRPLGRLLPLLQILPPLRQQKRDAVESAVRSGHHETTKTRKVESSHHGYRAKLCLYLMIHSKRTLENTHDWVGRPPSREHITAA